MDNSDLRQLGPHQLGPILLQTQPLLKLIPTMLILFLCTRVVIKINGHEDKRSSKFSNLNSVNSKIAETKQQNRLKQCFS